MELSEVLKAVEKWSGFNNKEELKASICSIRWSLECELNSQRKGLEKNGR